MAGIRNGGSSRFGSKSLTRRHPVPELSLPGFSFGRVRQVPHRALVNRAARRLGHPASIPRAIMSRSPEALALGPAVISFRRRYHCPSFGCLLNRSRDCTRSRVPPLSRRRYADPPAGASFSCLRFAPALSLPLCEAAFHRKSGGRRCARTSIVLGKREHDMRKFHSIAALCGDGLRPELRELFDRLAVDPNSELFVRHDGMLQSGPDPKSIEAPPVERAVPKRVA